MIWFGSMVFMLAAIGAFKGFWWGLAIGLVAYGVAAFLARQFNPTKFFTDDRERAAHDELVALIQNESPGHPSS